MKAILTSSLGGAIKKDGKRYPTVLIEENGLLNKIKENWPLNARVLMIAASPDDYEKNDSVIDCLRESFPMSGLNYTCFEMCDDRNEGIVEHIDEMDVLILIGGHVPTQNKFFGKIELKEKMKDFDGLLIAWSAGSMNCADIVYAGPELEGESIDPTYQRWIPGLGITQTNIFPHFQSLRNEILDGQRLIEDITFEDSMDHEIIALNDGSYLFIENKKEELFGDAYSIKDHTIRQICGNGESVLLRG